MRLLEGESGLHPGSSEAGRSWGDWAALPTVGLEWLLLRESSSSSSSS